MDDDDRTVPERPCRGVLTDAGEPRHPRPAGLNLEMPPTDACDYGVYGNVEQTRLGPMDMRPLLDLVAARYAGCDDCKDRQIAAVAASAALTTHMVGVCLLSLETHVAPARQLTNQLDPAGAAIALTVRNYGLMPAVEVAERLTEGTREHIVAAALNVLLQTGWINMPVSNMCPPGLVVDDRSLGDEAMLGMLRADYGIPE